MENKTATFLLITLFSILGVEGTSQTNCKDIYDAGVTLSGLYNITGSDDTFTVYCDMALRGGGWTVIQRRVNGDVAFNKSWEEYRNGFGNLTANFWLGLQKIRDITDNKNTIFELYIGMESFHPVDVARFALYESFSLGSESENYVLSIGPLDPVSDAGDSLIQHNGKQFSTPDQDNDSAPTKHCAEVFRAGWWFHNCHDSLLNGQWYDYGLLADLNVPNGIIWETWSGDRESLKATIMAVRPVVPQE